MRKLWVYAMLLISISFVAFSCNNQKTTQEYLREEKKAIERYIDRNDFDIISSYPENGVFGENQFFKTNEGLYIHVVDSGNGRRVTALVDQVQVRFDYFLYVKDAVGGDTSKVILDYRWFPFEFIYGNTASYSKDALKLTCNGWAIPLNYIGEGAIVDLIIPSSLGGTTDYNSFDPVYYKNLRYTKFY